MWIEFTKDCGEHKAGAFLDVADENVARAWITAGAAKDAKDGPDKILIARAVAEFREALSGVAREAAAGIRAAAEETSRRPHIQAGPAEADKRKGFKDYLRNIVVASDFRDPEGATKARDVLTKVYESRYISPNDFHERGLAESGGSTGGFTTPVMFENRLLETAWENAVITPGCEQVPLGARTVEYPALNQYTAPAAGQSAQFGGITVSRKTEVAQRSSSTIGFKKVSMTAVDMTAYTEISRDFIADSAISPDSKSIEKIGGAMGWREDWESLNGNGSGNFLGIYNAPATINVTRNTGSHIKYQDIFTMLTRLLPFSAGRACWVCHPYTLSEILAIQDPSSKFIMLPYPVGGGTSLGAAPQWQMLGMPLYATEKAPALGSTGDLLLVDRSVYLLGRRSGIEIGLSEHFKFDTDQIAIRAKLRNDGQPSQVKAITLADGTSTVSFAVQLQ